MNWVTIDFHEKGETNIIDPISAKCKASAYLITMGTKALLLDEQKDHFSSATLLNGVVEEAKIKQQMISEESMRLFILKISNKLGMRVLKRNRFGKDRVITLRFKPKQEGDYFTWKSRRLATQTKILLNTLMKCNDLIDDDRHDIEDQKHASDNIGVKHIPYLHIENTERSLDIKFSTLNEYLSCKEWLERNYIQNNSLRRVLY